MSDVVFKIRNRHTNEWAVGVRPEWTPAAFSAFYKSEKNAKMALRRLERQETYFRSIGSEWANERAEKNKLFLLLAEITPVRLERIDFMKLPLVLKKVYHKLTIDAETIKASTL